MTSAQDAPQRASGLLNEPRRLFLLLAPFLFAAYALLTPPFQNFDENQHVYRAWQISSFQLTGERRGAQSGGELPPGLGPATVREIGSLVPQGKRRAVVRPLSQIFSWNTPIGSNQAPVYYNFFGAVMYPPVGYIPQVTAIRVGEASGLSVEWTVRLGRLLNCILGIALIAWALRLLPFGRWVMATIALLPPTAAYTASFGQDSLIIGGVFILTALGLKIAVEKKWTAVGTLVLSVAGILVTISKVVYLPLIAVAAFPKPGGIAWHRWLARPAAIAAISVLSLAVWMRVNAHVVVPFRPWLPSVSEQAHWMVANPIEFVAILGRTFIVLLPDMWADLYRYGDSTVPLNLIAAIAGTASIFAIMAYGERPATELTRIRRIWMLCIVAGVALLVATALFVSYTPRGDLVILGIRARYFLPTLPLFVIALMRRGGGESPILLKAAIVLALVAHAAVLGTIGATFYSL